MGAAAQADHRHSDRWSEARSGRGKPRLFDAAVREL